MAFLKEEHEIKEKTFTTEAQRHREVSSEILRIFPPQASDKIRRMFYLGGGKRKMVL